MRRWHWALATVLSLAALLTALCVIKLGPNFEFLEGRTSFASKYQGDPMADIYTFQGDFASFKVTANRELMEKGYVRVLDGEMLIAVYERKEPGPPRTIKKGLYTLEASPDRVTLSNNMTAKAGSEADTDFSAKEGWITVIVEHETSDTWLDRFKDWLGL